MIAGSKRLHEFLVELWPDGFAAGLGAVRPAANSTSAAVSVELSSLENDALHIMTGQIAVIVAQQHSVSNNKCIEDHFMVS